MVNEYFTLHSYGGTLEYYLFELANFSALAFFAVFLYKLNYINSNSLLAWLAIFFAPLLLIILLFLLRFLVINFNMQERLCH